MDWQLITVLIVIAGAGAFVALRVVRLFGRRAKGSAACGGTCQGCGPQSAPASLVALDAVGGSESTLPERTASEVSHVIEIE